MASTGQGKEDRHVVVRLQYVWECFYHSKNIERCKHFIHPIDIILFTPWVFLSLFCHFLSWFSNYLVMVSLLPRFCLWWRSWESVSNVCAALCFAGSPQVLKDGQPRRNSSARTGFGVCTACHEHVISAESLRFVFFLKFVQDIASAEACWAWSSLYGLWWQTNESCSELCRTFSTKVCIKNQNLLEWTAWPESLWDEFCCLSKAKI